MGKKVKIRSMIEGKVIVLNNDLRFKRIWEQKGTVKAIDSEILDELMYDPGVEYMFKEGILHIEDEEVEKKISEETGTNLTELQVYTDKQMDRLMTVMPMSEFRIEVKKATYEQLKALADYAIKKEYNNIDKCTLLKELIDVDILNAININRKDKEEVGTPVE